MKVIGYGDNVTDRYVTQNMLYPGGNCINFAVYAKKAEQSRRIWDIGARTGKRKCYAER